MGLSQKIDLLEVVLAESRINALLALRRTAVQAVKAPPSRLLSVLKAKIAKDSQKAGRRPQLIGYDGYQWGFAFDGKKDMYLHYTTRKGAVDILKDMELKVPDSDPGQQPFSSFVISMTYGVILPSVQQTGRLQGVAREDIVGIVFKSDKQPKVGFPEETVFRGGTKIKNARMVDGRLLKEIEGRLADNLLVPAPYDYAVYYNAKDVEAFRTRMDRKR